MSDSLRHHGDCSLPGFSVHGILQARILECVGIHSLLQGIFLTQGSNPGLLHFRQTLYTAGRLISFLGMSKKNLSLWLQAQILHIIIPQKEKQTLHPDKGREATQERQHCRERWTHTELCLRLPPDFLASYDNTFISLAGSLAVVLSLATKGILSKTIW